MSGRASRARNALAALVIGTAFVLPLAFVPGTDDAFALPKVALLQIAAFAGGALLIAFVLCGGRVSRGATRSIDIPLAAFVGLTCLATVMSVDREQSLLGEPFQYQGLVTTLVYVGSFYSARLSIGTARRFRGLLVAIVASGSITAAYAIAQALGHDPFWPFLPEDGRVISGVGQANDLAAFLLIVLGAAYGLWHSANRVGRSLLVACAIGTSIGLVLTLSRGGYLALASVGIIVGMIHLRRPIRVGSAAIAITATLAIIAMVWAVGPGGNALSTVVDRAMSTTDLREGSIRSHLDTWAVGLAITAEHPLLGTGPETFPLVFHEYRDEVLAPDRARRLARFRPESPHNELIGIAAGSGLPALIAYLTFLVACGALAVRRIRTEPRDEGSIVATVCLLVLVIHIVTAFFKTPDATTSWLFMVVTGAGLAAMTDFGDPARRDVDQPDLGRDAGKAASAAARV